MKKHPLSACVSAWLLAAALSLSGTFCIVTSFQLAVNPALLAVGCVVVPLVFLFAQHFQRSGLLSFSLWILAAVAVFFLWRNELWNSFRYTVTIIASRYAKGYPAIPVPVWRTVIPSSSNATAILLLIGALLSHLMIWTVMQRQTVIPAVLFGTLNLSVCMVLLNTVPAHLFLFTFLGCFCLLLLTQGTRRRDANAGGKLTLLLTAPVAALLLVLSLLNPEESYVRSNWIETLESRLMQSINQLQWVQIDETGNLIITPPVQISPAETTDTVVLSGVGPMLQTHSAVMDVYADETASIYLKGRAYWNYTGTAWEDWPSDTQIPDAASSYLTPIVLWEATHTISVTKRTANTQLYTPYYVVLPTDGFELHHDAWLTGENSREFSFAYLTGVMNYKADSAPEGAEETIATEFPLEEIPVDENFAQVVLDSSYARFVQANYTQLPDHTRQELLKIIAAEGLSTVEDAIAYVKSSAAYSLDTPRMNNSEESDFVLWFLKESDTGYCVHFASAATALLRAMDIPARYVTGYVAHCTENEWATVTSDTAHAWVEYFDGNIWRPLEPTPGGSAVTETTQSGEQLSPTNEATEPGQTRPTSPDSTGPTGSPSSPNTPVSTMPEASRRSFSFGWLFVPLIPLAMWLAIWLRYAILRKKRHSMQSHSTNRQILQLWQRIAQLSDRLGRLLPEDLEAIALKARFSQHQCTPEETQAVLEHCEALVSELQKRPWYRRLFDRYILVLY